MTTEEHKQRHIELHKSLDELIADFVYNNSDLTTFTDQPIMALMTWSYQQTLNPTENEH